MSQSSFVCTQLNGFKYSKWLNISIWPIDGTLTDTTAPGQSGFGSNGNEGVLHVSPKFQDWNLTIRCSLVSYPEYTLRGVLTSAKTQSVYSTPRADKQTHIEGGRDLHSAKTQSMYSTPRADKLAWIEGRWGSYLCKDAVSIFYTLSWQTEMHWRWWRGILPLCKDEVSVFHTSTWQADIHWGGC